MRPWIAAVVVALAASPLGRWISGMLWPQPVTIEDLACTAELQRRPCVIDGQPSQVFADRTVGDCVRHNRAYDHDPAAHHWLRSVPCVIDGP